MSVRTIITTTAFRTIQAALLPLGAIGYLAFVARLFAHSRRTQASGTVLASFYTRWMQHRLRTRPDEICARLMAVLPNVPPLGLRLVTAPTLVANRLTDYVPRIYRYPYPGVPPMRHQPAARTTFYDAAVAQHLPGVRQLVILGAGLDTRAFRLPPQHPVRIFEVDTPRTQSWKRAMLERAGVEADMITFVPADFQEQDWFDELVTGGFDPRQPSLFLWESVTMYLDHEAVESTLRRIAGTAPGTVVTFDYFSTGLAQGRSLFWRYARAATRATGEPMRGFGIDTTPPARAGAEAFLATCGLSLREQRTFGEEGGGKQSQAGFVVAVVPPAAN